MGTQYWEPNLELQSERIHTFEIAREQNLHRRLNFITSAFHYRLRGLIEGVPVGDNILQYRNAATADATWLAGASFWPARFVTRARGSAPAEWVRPR